MLLALFPIMAGAVPAYPRLILKKQANGRSLRTFLFGDEYGHYYTTEDGAILSEGTDGLLYYSELTQDGAVKPSSVLANNAESRDMTEKELVARQDRAAILNAYQSRREKALQSMRHASR